MSKELPEALVAMFVFVSAVFFLIVFIQLLWLYVIVPINAKRSFWIRTDARYKAIEPSTLPPHFLAGLAHAARQLVTLRFTAVCYLEMPDALSIAGVGFEGIWISEDRTTLAKIIGTRTEARGLVPQTDCRHVSFFSKTTCGIEIATSNFALPPTSNYPAFYRSLRCAGLQNMERLFELHGARVRTELASKELYRFEETSISDFNQRICDEFQQYQVDTGRLFLDRDAGLYRYTWCGAFCDHWRLLFPWKQHFWRRELRRLTDLVAAAGIGPIERFTADSPSNLSDQTLDYGTADKQGQEK